jgi:hypothetical protein
MTRRTLLQTAAGAMIWNPYANGATSWLGDTFRELHVDAHFANLPAPYEDFDAERAAETLKSAGFQMVSLFAVCNGGYSYYPTKLGVVHPGLKRDFTGEFTRALKKRGVRVLAYVSVGRERRELPVEWQRSPGQMCPNSPWLEQAHIPQLKEIVELYEVDGFFFDSVLGKFVQGSCSCRWCREGDRDGIDHYRFLSRSGARYIERVIGALKPGLAYAMNHVWVTHNPVNPPAALKHLVWEPVPPYPGVLSLDFSLQARYLATLSGIENWSCMATRGNGWGDYSIRDVNTYLHEAAVALASGGRPYFGDDSYPSGNPEPALYKAYGEVNARTAALEPYVRGCAPVKDTAVLLSADSIWSGLPVNPPREWMGSTPTPGVAGAHKMLVEEHAQFSILNSETLVDSLSRYRALIVPEQRILGPRECEAIRRFVEAGGSLIATGDTGTRELSDQALDSFALGDVLGVNLLGRAEVRRSFLRHEYDIQVNGPYQRIEATTARMLAALVPPAPPRQAPASEPQGPAVTINRFGKGTAIYCAAPLFGAYHQDGTPALRRIASWLYGQAHPTAARSLALEHAPLSVEVVYTERGRDRFVHLINFTGDRRLSGPARLTDFHAVNGIQVRARVGERPKGVLAVPGKTPMGFEWKDGWVSFRAQPLVVHSAYWIQV